MNTRERWIVYPLLFLTLGIALRNQFLPTRRFGAIDLQAAEVKAQKIICNEVIVMEKASGRKLEFEDMKANHVVGGLGEFVQTKSREMDCLGLKISSEEGKPIVLLTEDSTAKAGVLQMMNEKGTPLAQIRPTSSGAAFVSWRSDGKALVAMGHEGENFGVFAQFPQAGPPFPLTSPWRFQGTPTPGAQPQQIDPKGLPQNLPQQKTTPLVPPTQKPEPGPEKPEKKDK